MRKLLKALAVVAAVGLEAASVLTTSPTQVAVAAIVAVAAVVAESQTTVATVVATAIAAATVAVMGHINRGVVDLPEINFSKKSPGTSVPGLFNLT
jgi:hypothetical protein